MKRHNVTTPLLSGYFINTVKLCILCRNQVDHLLGTPRTRDPDAFGTALVAVSDEHGDVQALIEATRVRHRSWLWRLREPSIIHGRERPLQVRRPQGHTQLSALPGRTLAQAIEPDGTREVPVPHQVPVSLSEVRNGRAHRNRARSDEL